MLSFLNRLSPIAVLVTPALLASAAFAQVQTVAPYYACVTVDKSSVHSGDNDRFYRVGELATGDIVLVDGEGHSWSRIAYPANFPAVVRVENVKVDGTNATLTNPNKLLAGNSTSNFTPSTSWKSLMDNPLPAGTTLKVIGPVKDGEAVVAYKVVAPEGARAFVESRILRHATDAEVSAFKAKGTVPAMPTATAPTALTTPSSDPKAAPGAQPQGTQPMATGPNAVKPLVGPVAIDASKPIDPKTTPVAAKPADREVGSYEALENRFKAVWKQEELSAEVGELMAEYKRAAGKVPADDPETKRALEGRIQALELRVELREKIRRQEEARANLNKSKTELAKQIEAWDKSRVYTIVGQLQPSTVYDGKHLPQMFRIVSVGGATTRTLGYLKPSDDIDLTKKLGQVVGVIGEANMDRSLKLNIINPTKVDTLRPGVTPEATTANVEEQGDEVPKSPSK